MIVLGIDPGSHKTGYAIMERTSAGKILHLNSGVIFFNKEDSFFKKIHYVKIQLRTIFSLYQIDTLAIESLIFVKNPHSLIKLAQIRGVILGEFIEKFSDNIFEYSPNEIKQAVTCHGHASKENVQKAVTLITGKEDFQSDDESDACAIVICHLFSSGPSSRDFVMPKASPKTKKSSKNSPFSRLLNY